MFVYWKEWARSRKDLWYRLQTDESKIHYIMRDRKRFKLVGRGFNCKLWLYRTSAKTPQAMKKVFNSIKNLSIKKGEKE